MAIKALSGKWTALLAIVLLSLIAATAVGASQVSAQPTNREFIISASQFAYDPPIIRVNAGDNVTIRLRSEDVSHGLYIDGYEVNAKFIIEENFTSPEPTQENEEVEHVTKSEEVINFIADKPGVFRFRCSVTCGAFHPFMIGKLVVEPDNQHLYSSILAAIIALLMVGLFWRRLKRKTSKPSKPYFKKFNLLRIGIIKRIVKLRSFQFLVIFPNLVIFILIILTGFFGVQVGNQNFAIVIVWILWWSALMLLMVPFLARFWCMICPLPSFGEWAQRGTLTGVKEKRFGLKRRWPKKLDNIWIQNFAFLAFSIFLGIMITRPWATGLLMILLFLMALIISLIFVGRTFCRYVCPVSGFIGLYSNFSTLELRVKDRKVCEKHVEKDCIRGNECGHGCPWLEFPQHMNRNSYCGLCTECIKTCPKDNIALNVRAGGEDLYVEPWGGIKKRGLDEAWKAFIMMGIAILYGLVFMGPYGVLKGMANIASWQGWALLVAAMLGLTLLLIPAIYFIFVWLSKAFSGVKGIPLRRLFINYSYTLIPIGLLTWMAFSVAILFINGSYIISGISDPFGWGWNLFGTAGYSWTPYFSGAVPYIQIALTLVGLVLSLRATFEISKRTFEKREQAFKASIPIVVMLTALAVLLMWVWVG